MPGTVLIVEDVETCASTLEIALSGISDLRIVTVPSAEQAWQLLKNDTISLLITDLHMPGMDGFQLIEQLRSDPEHAALPVVVITGCTNADTPERVRKLGINAFFSKPYSPIQVRYKVEQLLE